MLLVVVLSDYLNGIPCGACPFSVPCLTAFNMPPESSVVFSLISLIRSSLERNVGLKDYCKEKQKDDD